MMRPLDSNEIPKPANRQDWLKLRQPYVGASDAATLIDRNDFDSLGRYAARKIAGTEQPETKAMRRGRTLEAGVALLWQEETGRPIIPCPFVLQRGPLISTLDYVGFDDADLVVEIKTYGRYCDWPLPSWRIQCYVQAWCGGYDAIELAVLDSTMQLKTFRVDCTTDEYHVCIEQVVAAAEQFLKYTSEGKIPEGLKLDAVAVRALFPRAERRSIEVDVETVAWVAELADSRELAKVAKDREAKARDAIAEIMRDADVMEFNGIEVLTWRSGRDVRKLDMESLTADNPDLIEKYTRELPGARTMRITNDGRVIAESMPWAANDESEPF